MSSDGNPHTRARLLAEARDVADGDRGAAARFGLGHAVGHQALGLPRDVLRQLLAQLVVEPAAGGTRP